ncbi:TlpA family protein disulfide reductase [Arcobacter sp. FWKO B]|uniref:TlpA family protein disulfide reductase n=1 Tax=Arcobacter sp. FWKO B TaxID=2593672 RepID=UPI0018A597C9|nr:TlpA disulfide reductase family protein [Arcobacter sp. FWKO B]QOG11435.1 TlpA family protein disulfide reductase [Arcobacter sp. FWKO B]
MKFKKLAFLTILSILLFGGCDSKDGIDSSAVAKKSQKAPEFNLITTNQEQILVKVVDDKWVFQGLENKVILLNFFATWCPPCKAEIPHLISLKNKYPQFEVVAVLVEQDKSNDEINSFIAEHNINYPVTNSNMNFILADAVGGVSTIPTMFLFDSEGTPYQKYVGMVPEEMLASDIQKATITKE